MVRRTDPVVPGRRTPRRRDSICAAGTEVISGLDMHTDDGLWRWSGDEAALEWLSTLDCVSMFAFSEVPSWLGALGEIGARTLAAGRGRLSLHLWTRAVPYQADTAVPEAAWEPVEAALMKLLRVRGGGRALAGRLVQLAPGRVTVDEAATTLEPAP